MAPVDVPGTQHGSGVERALNFKPRFRLAEFDTVGLTHRGARDHENGSTRYGKSSRHCVHGVPQVTPTTRLEVLGSGNRANYPRSFWVWRNAARAPRHNVIESITPRSASTII